MFDLITGTTERPLRERSPRSKLVSAVAHAVVIPLVLGLPIVLTSNSAPPLPPTMIAFVAPPPEAPLPPPPPPPAHPEARRAEARPAASLPAPTQAQAPIDLGPAAAEEAHGEGPVVGGEGAGVAGGVEGGVEGGIVGGLVGSPATTPRFEPIPAPPAAPPPAPSPIRVGAQVVAPALVHRVEPIYPPLAVASQLTGVVILDATVDIQGCVQSVTVLAGNPILAKAAIDAVRQWQYRPVMLNGVPVPFILNVVLSFRFR